tara:strand:+ start:70 stop:387 length:318 start_codon:yes stop_codon:yes gene_type:complete
MWKAEVQLQQLEYEGIFQWISPNRKKCYLCASTQNLTLLPLNGELICKNCKERLLPQKPKQSNDECEKKRRETIKTQLTGCNNFSGNKKRTCVQAAKDATKHIVC